MTKRRVLIVDDNADAAQTLAVLVKMFGHEAHETSDALKALEIAASLLPDMILLDLGMPKMDGFEVARHIRQQTWSQGMILVALTGWGQDADREKTRNAGFDHHLVKPADLELLEAMLNAPAAEIRHDHSCPN